MILTSRHVLECTLGCHVTGSVSWFPPSTTLGLWPCLRIWISPLCPIGVAVWLEWQIEAPPKHLWPHARGDGYHQLSPQRTLSADVQHRPEPVWPAVKSQRMTFNLLTYSTHQNQTIRKCTTHMWKGPMKTLTCPLSACTSCSYAICSLSKCWTVFRSRPSSAPASVSFFSRMSPRASRASWWKRCSSYEAPSICVRVSMSSSRSAQASLSPSFHSATLAFSGWPDSISSSAWVFTASTRSWPIVLVSRANSRNLSRNIWRVERKHPEL